MTHLPNTSIRDAVGNVIQVHGRNGSNLGEILDATVGKALVVGYIILIIRLVCFEGE